MEVRQAVLFEDMVRLSDRYSRDADVVLFTGGCLDLLSQIPDGEARLVVTSPPYNLGKPYERRLQIAEYLRQQESVIKECVRILAPNGSLCRQVGNHIQDGEVFPLDTLLYPILKALSLKLRNRIIWHFEHGLHCKRRFSGRYECIMWFTKSEEYVFNLDPVRIPQKYPGKKHFKGPRKGKCSSNPLGKNPEDLWVIPNVKHNHPEKTIHPCQFPVELVERLVLSMTLKGDLVFDPFMGVGSTAVAALLNERRAAGADTVREYVEIAKKRVRLASTGMLATRPMGKPVYEPAKNSKLARNPFAR